MADKKKGKSTREKNAPGAGKIRGPSVEDAAEKEPLNHEQERLLAWFQTVKFKRTVFNGLDEQDVWKKLSELNDIYEAALSAERARYDAMLKAYVKSANATILECRKELEEERRKHSSEDPGQRDEDAQRE